MIEANLVGEVPHVLKNVTNVMGFLGATKGGTPVPMRKTEINRILGKVDNLNLSEEQVNIPFVIGETVKVIDGPFNSFHAEIEAIDEQKKLQLMVKIFGRKTPLELNFMQVEKNLNMAKEISGLIKLQIRAGAANPAPPVGPALGAKGVNIMEFCKQFNARTQDKAGSIVPVIITVYADKSFEFVTKTAPAAVQILAAAKKKKRIIRT